MFAKLELLEKEGGWSPDAEIYAFIKASNLVGKRHNIVTEYVLRLLGLEASLLLTGCKTSPVWQQHRI